MEKYFIYRLVFPNNKIYVGQTKNFRNRMYHHKNVVELHNNKYLDNAIRKYKWVNIKKEILIECDMKYADFFERKFIFGYNSTNRQFGYNLESGGNKNKILSEETKIKIGNANRGKKHSKQSIEKMRNAKIGIKQTKENIKKRAKSNTGKIRTEEMKIKMSNSAKNAFKLGKRNNSGVNNPMYGKKHREESKQKMGCSINSYDINGNFIESFKSITNASTNLGIDKSGIHKVLNGTYKYTKGFSFRYN